MVEDRIGANGMGSYLPAFQAELIRGFGLILLDGIPITGLNIA